MNISVIIPNFNGENLLKKNLLKVADALSAYKEGKKEIIVADDSSVDNSISVAKEICRKFPKSITWHIVENKSGKNKGFSINVNAGVAASHGDILILLNTDVAPHKNFLEPLIEHFADDNVFAVGCMDESIEDGKIVLRGRGVGRWKRGFLNHAAGSLDKTDTLWVSGGSSAFRRNIWDTLGGLQELYSPFYWEDIDLSYKAQKAGYAVLFEKKSVVKHEHEEGAIKKNYSAKQVTTTAYRNQFFFTWLNATDTIILVSHFVWLPYLLFKNLMKQNWTFCKGFLLALQKLPKVLTERKKVQQLVKISDKAVTQKYSL